jgi:hypothetical protein
MAGSTTMGSGGNDAYVMKVNTAGDIEWCKTFGTVRNEKAMSIKATGNGYVVGGRTEGFRTQADLYLFKVDNYGNEIWSRAYGSDSYDEGTSMAVSGDGGFILTGMYRSYILNQGDIYFVKTDSLGHSGCREIIVWTRTTNISPTVQTLVPQVESGVFSDTTLISTLTINMADSVLCNEAISMSPQYQDRNSITFFPNPSHGRFTIEAEEPISQISVFNLLGERVLTSPGSSVKMDLDLGVQASGIYIVRLQCNKQFFTQKVLIE